MFTVVAPSSSVLPFVRALAVATLLFAHAAHAQSIAFPWSSHGHDPQHTGLSQHACQPLNRILWQAPVDLTPQYSGTELLAHYGSPLITRQNTVIFPVKTAANSGFQIEAHAGQSGALVWKQTTDYVAPAHDWFPPCGIALTPKNRLYYPGAGGTVYFRDNPESPTAPPGGTGQIAFYGTAAYQANPATYTSNVEINTPITADRYGNIYFGFVATGPTSKNLVSGIATITIDGAGTWVSAASAAADPSIVEPVQNCAPALSNDHRTLYIAVSYGSYSGGYLLALDTVTLATTGKVRLKDVDSPVSDAVLPDNGTASPTIGPDGDVYFGVLEDPLSSNHYRGWLLHFNKTLSQAKLPGAFGWDDTPSIVPASLVPGYDGPSSYLLLTKYNNYAQAGGGGANKVALLDPDVSEVDSVTGALVMNEVLTQLGPTPDPGFPNTPGAVREWCVNTVAIDPFTKCAVVHNEDGNVYRWDFASNSLTQTLNVSTGLGSAYTPSVIGVDGTAYVIANATLFALGQ